MIKVCHVNNLPEKSAKVVMVHDTPIAVFNEAGEILAWDNRSTPPGASLSDGYITDKTVQCNVHVWICERIIECSAAKEAIKLKSFLCVIREGDIFLII